MSWPIYSVRIMQAFGAGVETTYTVPAGKRLVIRHLVARNDASSGAKIWLRVNNVWIYLHDFPASTSSISVPMMVVAYSGEKVVLYTVTIGVAGSLSGFLFNDAAPSAGDDPVVTRERRELAEPLPST